MLAEAAEAIKTLKVDSDGVCRGSNVTADLRGCRATHMKRLAEVQHRSCPVPSGTDGPLKDSGLYTM